MNATRESGMATMKAAVIYEPGGPEVLKLETRPVPQPGPGQILIRVKAFGLNRSEMFTRQGLSPNVTFPRILGIEAVGFVEDAPGAEFARGDKVATVMGGMGRDFDGSYAEYTCVPAHQVRAVRTSLPWETFGAVPEMLQTASGSLFRALRLQPGERLLIRGGTTSVGMAAAAIAKRHGASVASTSRNPDSVDLLRAAGADETFMDDGNIAAQMAARWPGGADKVLELVGTATLYDSLRCVKEPGLVCMTGIVGNKWSIDDFSPMAAIPTGVGLTTYDGGVADFMRMDLQALLDQIVDGTLRVQVGKVYQLDEIAEAHQMMDSNKAGGKIVVLV